MWFFEIFFEIFGFFDHLKKKLFSFFLMDFWIFFYNFFLDFLDFLEFFGFLEFLNFFGFVDTKNFQKWIFGFFFIIFFGFFGFFGIFWIFWIFEFFLDLRTPKMSKNGPKQHNKRFFARKAKKASAKGQSPPQELEVGQRSRPYLLVCITLTLQCADGH